MQFSQGKYVQNRLFEQKTCRYKLKSLMLPILGTFFLIGCNDSSNETNNDPDTPATESYFDTTNPPNFDITLPTTNGPIAKLSGSEPVTDPIEPSENQAIIYLVTKPDDNADYRQYSLYTWNDENCDRTGPTWLKDWSDISNTPAGIDQYGPYWQLPLKEGDSDCLNIIIRDVDLNNQLGSDARPSLSKSNHNIALIPGSTTAYLNREEAYLQLSGIANAQAHLISGDQLVWKNAPTAASEYRLYVSLDAKIELDDHYQYTQPYVVMSPSSLTAEQEMKFPSLSQDSVTLSLDDELDIRNIIKAQLVAMAIDAEGNVLAGTQVQTANSLDSLFAANAQAVELGSTIQENGQTQFQVWAPSAQNTVLVLFDDDKKERGRLQMDYNANSGVWSTTTDKATSGAYYLYDTTVFHPASNKVEHYKVSDPYSLSLSTNSAYSQVVNLNDPELKPQGWDDLQRPVKQDNPAEFVIYESHVRDFSAQDKSTPENYRGKYLAFTQQDSIPVKHMRSLSQSGVTHLHLLPIFDIATINESKDKVANIEQPFSKLCLVNSKVESSEFSHYCNSNLSIIDVLNTLAESDTSDSSTVQSLNRLISETDSFNWGYDPFHYTAPEGSYSTSPEGTQRILETRQMVQAIKSNIGMNVVMDVVYNHTNSAGPDNNTSVLDKIVPWYYNRLNPITGTVENSTCCSNTAPEHTMMGKLIRDSLVVWAREYKIDAFRFDLMAHHPLTQIEDALKAVQAVDPKIYFYGEGWNFGEVADDALFIQASQAHLAGTGIGSFSDRLRDAVRGGSPFDSQEGIRKTQGFGNGAWVQPNDITEQVLSDALQSTDLVRLGMAGNLKAFQFIDANDKLVRGDNVDYNGQPAGYAQDPTEIQNYVSKHDNQTLWDNNQYKVAYATSLDERVRMQAVSLATAMLGQGVPFTHMGSEILRSKSMQRDSYDSGDWFNKVDFTLHDNNWDKGLPRQDKDGENYPIITQVIDTHDVSAKPNHTEIAQMMAYYQDLAKLRHTYPLLRLGKGEEVIKRIAFHNTGSTQVPGLIVMSIDNGTNVSDFTQETPTANKLDGLIVAINASPNPINFTLPTTDFVLSSVYQSDLAQGVVIEGSRLALPAWTPAVLELPRKGERGIGIPVVMN